jgi:hypothetical protein
MKKLNILLSLTITGSMCGMSQQDSAADKLKSFRTMVNSCDQSRFEISKIATHFNANDYQTITVNQMIDTLETSVQDLRYKKNKWFFNTRCSDCQHALNICEEKLKYLKVNQGLTGGDGSVAQHHAWMELKQIVYDNAPLIEDFAIKMAEVPLIRNSIPIVAIAIAKTAAIEIGPEVIVGNLLPNESPESTKLTKIVVKSAIEAALCPPHTPEHIKTALYPFPTPEQRQPLILSSLMLSQQELETIKKGHLDLRDFQLRHKNSPSLFIKEHFQEHRK